MQSKDFKVTTTTRACRITAWVWIYGKVDSLDRTSTDPVTPHLVCGCPAACSSARQSLDRLRASAHLELMVWNRARMTRNKVSTLGLWTPITYHHYLPEVDSQQQHGKICDYPSDGSAAISFDSIHPDSPGYNIQKETPMSCACRKMVRTI